MSQDLEAIAWFEKTVMAVETKYFEYSSVLRGRHSRLCAYSTSSLTVARTTSSSSVMGFTTSLIGVPNVLLPKMMKEKSGDGQRRSPGWHVTACIRTSTPSPAQQCGRSVHTLERRHRLALILVERVVDDVAVLDLDLGRLDVVLPSERVLHPVLVVTL